MWKTLETTELCGELYKLILSHILTFLMISYEILNLKNKQKPFFHPSGPISDMQYVIVFRSGFENDRTFLHLDVFDSAV